MHWDEDVELQLYLRHKAPCSNKVVLVQDM
jgi:hypothetical protein